MQKLITILLCFALYAPNVAQLISYSECSMSATSNSEQKICDCLLEKTIANNNYPVDKHEHHIIKADWQYIITPKFNFTEHFIAINNLQHSTNYLLQVPICIGNKIFHPPAVSIHLLS